MGVKKIFFYRLELVQKSNDKLIVKSGDNSVHIQAKPLRIDFYNGDDLVVSANSRGLLRFEFLRQKPQP